MNTRLILLLVIGYGVAVSAGIDPYTVIVTWVESQVIDVFGFGFGFF